MIDPTSEPPRVSADRLRSFISQAFETAGLTADDAGILGELIAEAELRGSDTHGVFRMPLYVRRIRAGGINLWPNIRIIEEQPATALVDGDNAMGHLVMRFAAQTAIAKARQTGLGWVGARMSNHAGPASSASGCRGNRATPSESSACSRASQYPRPCTKAWTSSRANLVSIRSSDPAQLRGSRCSADLRLLNRAVNDFCENAPCGRPPAWRWRRTRYVLARPMLGRGRPGST
jgi:hypothetical protein